MPRLSASRPRRALRIAALFWLALAGAFAWRLAGVTADDIFITYRYAHNLARGEGLVFNPGERVFGVTEPAVALVLGALHAATRLPIPALGALLTATALVAVATLLAREAAERGPWPEALAGGTLLVASGFLWINQGAAGPIVVALLLAAARWGAARPCLAGTLAGLAAWFRPDAALGIALLGLLLWAEARRPPWRYAAAALGVVAAGAFLAWAWFGSVLPATLAAKRFHAARNPGAWLGYRNFFGTALAQLQTTSGRWVALFALLGAAGIPLLWRRSGRAGRLLAVNGMALALVYPWLGVPFFAWYVIPCWITVLYGASFLGGAMLRRLRRSGAPRGARLRDLAPRLGATAVLLGLVVVGAPLASATVRVWRVQERGHWRLEIYRPAGEWLRAHAPPEARLAFHEVGAVAFYSERPVDDLLGLVSAHALPYAREGDVVGAFLARPGDYFLGHPYADGGVMRGISSRPWFRDGYEEAARLQAGRDGDRWIVIYRRRPGASLPPPRPPRPLRRLPSAPSPPPSS